MSERLKHNENLQELIRYRNNKMTDKQRYTFERELERDPFFAEALEGMEQFKISEIEEDLDAIDLIAGKKRRKVKPVVYLSVAASILVVVISSILFTNRPDKTSTANNKLEPEASITPADSTLLVAFTDTTVVAEVDSLKPLFVAARIIANTPQAKKKTPEKSQSIEHEIVSERAERSSKKVDATQPIIIAAIQADEFEDGSVENPVVIYAEKSTRDISDADELEKIVESPDEVDDPVQSTISPAEKDIEANKRIGANADPSPLGGEELFKTYIKENLRYPGSAKEAKREVVRLEFSVAATGEISEIAVTKAPENKDFEKEAIRLIRNGPLWSPAVKDGIPVIEKVTYKLVFKSE